jgi:hypothetical protein
LASGHVTDLGESNHLRAVLLAYCERDMLALFEVHGRFRNDIFVVPLWKFFVHNAHAAQGS